MMRLLKQFIVIAVVTWVATTGVAQEKTITVEDMKIQLLNSDGRVVSSTTTDKKGEWSFTDLSPGTYTINIPASTIEIVGMAINSKWPKYKKTKTDSHARTASADADNDGA